MADIFAVVADPTRRDLLTILRRPEPSGSRESGEFSVSELVAELALSQPTVSKHLKVLREARLVSVREKGQHRYYRLEPSPLAAVADWIAPFVPADDTPNANPGPVVDRTADSTRTVPPARNGAPGGHARYANAGASALTATATSVGRLAADIHYRLRGSA